MGDSTTFFSTSLSENPARQTSDFLINSTQNKKDV
jgi:hypothetical protein